MTVTSKKHILKVYRTSSLVSSFCFSLWFWV